MTRPKSNRAIALLLIAVLGTAHADPFADARSEFMAAYQRVGVPASVPAAEDSAALQAYPLYPYLQASRLQQRLEDPDAAASIEAFLTAHGNAPVARSLRRSWLMSLAQRKAWEPYLAAYREDVDSTAAARCNALAARVALGRVEGLAEAITEVYLNPSSLPPACDPAFDWLRAQGLLSPQLVERARATRTRGRRG